MEAAKIVRPTDEKKTIHGAGDVYSFLAVGAETNGHYFLMEAVVPPGGGPPPHIQTREEEGFYILEGEVVFSVDGERHVATTGTFLHVPRGIVHNFKNDSKDVARMIIFFAPAGIEGLMEKLADSPADLLAIGREYGVEYLDES